MGLSRVRLAACWLDESDSGGEGLVVDVRENWEMSGCDERGME